MGQVAAELGNAHPNPDALTNLNTHPNLDARSNPNAGADIIFKRDRSIVDERSNSGSTPPATPTGPPSPEATPSGDGSAQPR
jgi:hypothetical protein